MCGCLGLAVLDNPILPRTSIYETFLMFMSSSTIGAVPRFSCTCYKAVGQLTAPMLLLLLGNKKEVTVTEIFGQMNQIFHQIMQVFTLLIGVFLATNADTTIIMTELFFGYAIQGIIETASKIIGDRRRSTIWFFAIDGIEHGRT